MGLVSPVGVGIEENWSNLISGKSGIGPITRFDSSGFTTRIAGEVKNFHPEEFISKKELRKMDPFLQFALGSRPLCDGRRQTEDRARDLVSSRRGDGLRPWRPAHDRGIPQTDPGSGSKEGKPLFHSDDYQQYGPRPYLDLPRRKRSQSFFADCVRRWNSRHRSGLPSHSGRVFAT